jgi:16S rRNA (guanine966-N2)-methyltransferase
MRVIGGELGGRRLRAPAGMATRPTSDRLREALFNILGADVVGSRFLDLFAGSGAVGIEALSRGAEYAVFVESSRRALEILEDNLHACGLAGRARIVPKNAVSALRLFEAAAERFDVAYVDPPYDAELYTRVLYGLGRSDLIAADGLVVAERRSNATLLPEYGRLRNYRDVRHGDSTLAFFRLD